MEQLLVVGIDSVVGANIAALLADDFRMLGISTVAPVSIDGCESIHLPLADASAARQIAASRRPDRIVCCAAAGDSPWSHAGERTGEPTVIANAEAWIHTASDLGIPLTFLSSDAVFTGPWMFHSETSDSFCSSRAARALRGLESAALAGGATALVVRTHAYGWSPRLDAVGWIEGALAALESEQRPLFDCIPHATPILASDLADILRRSWEAGLSGLFHVAGGERVNPHRFVCALARVFDLAPPRPAVLESAEAQAASGSFARKETSLRTQPIRRALGVAMPLLCDGLERLRQQQDDGFDRRLRGSRRLPPAKVA